jgi:hypothetical protein
MNDSLGGRGSSSTPKGLFTTKLPSGIPVYTPAGGPLKSFDLAVFLGDTKKASGGLDAVSSGAKKVADGLQGFPKRQKDAQATI